MFNGDYLPMRPAQLVGIYLSLWFLTVFLGGPGFIGLVIMIATVALHGIWVLQAALYATQNSPNERSELWIGNRAKKLKFLGLITAGLFSLAVIVASHYDNPQPPIPGFLIAAALLSVLVFFWQAAKTIVEAESASAADLLAPTLGTFFMLYFLIIGAFFVFRRLKRLDIEPQRSS